MRRLSIAAGCVLAAACTVEAPQSGNTAPARPAVEHITMVDPWPYPFSSAVKTGNMLYLSGQIGTRVENGAPVLVTGGIEAEARQTMENIKAILERGGSSFERVVKCSVMLADMREWPKLNEIYATLLSGQEAGAGGVGGKWTCAGGACGD